MFDNLDSEFLEQTPQETENHFQVLIRKICKGSGGWKQFRNIGKITKIYARHRKKGVVVSGAKRKRAITILM